jgi:hypothetical protein
MWVAPARISGKTLRDANQFMFCGQQYRSLRRLGGALSPVTKKPPNPSTKDEAQLNCVALRPPLDYEVAWRAVKGQDERLKSAPLTDLHATQRSIVDVEEKTMEAATSALTFCDLLIEV